MKKFFSAKPKQQEKDPIPTTTPTQQHTPIHQQHAVYRDEDDYHLVETPPRSPSPGPKSQQQSKKPAPVLGILKALDPDSPIEQTDHSRRDVKWFAGWNRDRDREKDKQWQMVDKDSTALTRMIGFLTATSSEDWALVLEVCETASAGETSAKEAVRALRREFKYGEPQAQLSAARLWAIMLRNSSDTFIAQSTSRKFLDTLEDLIRNPATNPVVKERVLDVIAAAAYASASKKDTTGFRGLWRRVKSPDKPDEGIPFDTDDAMFNPPIAGHRGSYYEGQFSLGSAGQFPPGSIVPGTTPNLSTGTLPITQIDTLPLKETQKDNKEKDREKSERKHRHRDHSERERSHKDRENRERERDKDGHKDKSHRKKEKKSTKDKIIPLEEDIRRLFQECKIGMGNAGLLSQAVGHTKPEELDLEADGKDVISEFQIKCMSSQELIAAQIPWASASADKSRREREREKILLYAQDTEHVRQRTVSQSSVNVIHALSPNLGRTGSTASIPLSTTAQGQDDFDDEQTTEERLLAALLEANEELLGALKQYDDLKRVAVEKRVESISRRDKRGIPPSSTPFEDSTLSASGASHSVDRARTPSPTGSFTSAPLPNPHPATRSQTPTLRDRAERPSSRPSSMLMMHPSGELLVPPHPHAPAGPRSPGHGQLAHSPGSTQSPPSQYHQPPSRTPSPRTPVLDLNFATSTESTLNGKHDGHVDVLDGTGSLRRLQDIGNGHKKLDNEEEDAQTPIKPSAKALGKRKIVEAPTHDSTVHERTENSEERSGWGGVEVDQDGEIGMFKTNGEYTANDGSSIHESYDGKGRLESEDWDDKSSLYGAGDDSESDDSRDRAEYDRNRWILKHMMHPPVHFVYDAVAERTKEWLKEGMKGIEIQKESEMKNKETAVVGG